MLSAIRSQVHLKMTLLMDSEKLCFHQWDPSFGPVVGSWTMLMAWFVWEGIWAF